MATEAARADTFPKLLIRNAQLYPGRPAYRHKDLGIWQVWTWGEVLEQVRAYAAGLSRLGLERGNTIAIVGSNRPRLYWSVTAAQMLGAVPVPVYADAVADELAYVLAHADVRFAAVEDQEQVDKILSVSERLPKLAQVIYDQPRGLRDYDHSRLHAIDDVIKDGRAALASEASGQRGHSKVRAPDTRPEPGSSARAALASEASGQRGHSKVRAPDTRPEPGSSARAALASEASGQRGHSKVRAPDTRPEPGSSARAALASEASGQRGHSKVRAHGASEDARERADDTRPEPGSSARAALASEASGQRGHSKGRAHGASEDARERADDTRPEPGSSARAALAGDATLAQWLDREIETGKGSDPSIILYTSGTTGQSKGVVLSAIGCINAASDTVAFDRLTERDEALAYLPLAWVGDHYLNYAQALVAGFCLACPESADTAMADMKEIGPTFFFAPPRVFEQMLTRVMIRMEDASPIKRRLFHAFLGVARRYGEKILNGERVPLAARVLYALGEFLVYGPLKNVLGLSCVRIAYTAGEAIGPDLFSFYRSIGLNLKQLYGQTEAFLYLTAQPDGKIYADTVGAVMTNVDLRIAENGEVLFKSPGMFVGYFKDAGKTAEVMTEDGYVKTGDAGFIDPKTGHLKIIDRAKDVGRLNNGALFAPKYIENKLKFYPNIREAVVYGDERDFVCAMLNIDLTAVGNWAERNNIVYGSYQELAGHPRVYDMLARHVEEVNRALAEEKAMAGAQIRRFLILHKELDADDGEVTRTQKVRREFVAERYAPLIKALYDGAREADISTEVTFEDGRKGTLSARVKIRDVATTPVAAIEKAA